MSHYRTDDITFCSKHRCTRKTCYRHPDNRINKSIPYSVSDWEGTAYCAKVKPENNIEEVVVTANDPISIEIRNKEIVRLRESGITCAEIAKRYGLSRQRIYQLLEERSENER